jgi:hypothetical protein
LTILNPAVKSILSKQAGKLSAKGVNKDQIIRASDKLLLKESRRTEPFKVQYGLL